MGDRQIPIQAGNGFGWAVVGFGPHADTTTGALKQRIHVGRGPHGLSVYPQPGTYSLGHTGIFR